MWLAPELTQTLSRLNLTHAPVAVSFLDEPPHGVPRIAAPLPAGCAYWKHASEGHAFFTTPDDHQNCPVGAFTHNVPMSPGKSEELQSLVGMMIELKYLSAAEVPAIPRLNMPMACAVYTPLDRATSSPAVVIFRGNARQVMILSEAARAAGTFEPAVTMGRPACAMIPQAMRSQTGAASIACIGNRVYTGLGDDELYLTVPGERVEAMLGKLAEVIDANSALERFHRERAGSLAPQ
jgi:uncharacterized protein (DUF169 family)